MFNNQNYYMSNKKFQKCSINEILMTGKKYNKRIIWKMGVL